MVTVWARDLRMFRTLEKSTLSEADSVSAAAIGSFVDGDIGGLGKTISSL
jgi:hypothetical protein